MLTDARIRGVVFCIFLDNYIKSSRENSCSMHVK